MTMQTGKRVCVIGAGIAGLVTAKVFTEDGFDVTVFERMPELGGVWASARTYPGLRTNNTRDTYAFSDFPYPAAVDDYPTAEQVRAYLGAYADHFNIRPLIRLSTEVVAVARAAANPDEDREFAVSTRLAGTADVDRHCFDFVVICNGVFSEPWMPPLEGRDMFAGLLLHSSRANDPVLMEGRRVVVVGSGKSALDLAAWASRHGSSCTLVFRTPHWMVPRYFFGFIRSDRVIMTRFGELFLRYHHLSRVEEILHGPARPLVRAWWRVFSWMLVRLVGAPDQLKPEKPLPRGYENVGVGCESYEMVRKGKLALRRGSLLRCTAPDSLVLDTGETIHADTVIFATGWRQSIPFLDPVLQARIVTDGRLRLYRHILPPRIRNIGFIGYASSTACQLTSEIAAHWLSQCFRHELALPVAEAMEREITGVLRWAAETFPDRSQGYYIGPYVAHYLDELLGDMGLPRRRLGNPFAEYFSPFMPDRYRTLGEQRRRARSGGKQNPG